MPHGFEYFRHGTLSLYAALETRSGQLIASTARRNTSQEFVRFLQEVVATQPSGKEIRPYRGQPLRYKTKRVGRFLTSLQVLLIPGRVENAQRNRPGCWRRRARPGAHLAIGSESRSA